MQTKTQPHNKRSVHGALLEYADADQIDTKAKAEKHQITPQAIGAYFKSLKGGPLV